MCTIVTLWKRDVINGIALQLLVDLQAGNPIPAAFMLAIETVLNIILMATPPQTEYLTLVYKTDNHTRIAYNVVMEASQQLNVDTDAMDIVVTEKLSTKQLQLSDTDTIQISGSVEEFKRHAKIVREAQNLTENGQHSR